MYDYIIIGAGLFGATFARLMTDKNKKCLVIDSRSHIGGNVYTEQVGDIHVHKYGPHIFHTNDDNIWKFVNQYADFDNFIFTPKAFINNKLYSLPFNLNTFDELWGCKDADSARQIIESQRTTQADNSLEQYALSTVGKDIYELLIKGFTAKQWGKDPKHLPASIIKRLPLRFERDNNYFNDKYQGIPKKGYTDLVNNLLKGIEVRLNVNYFDAKAELDALGHKVVFTGKIDEYFGYCFGELEYRTMKFETSTIDKSSYQGYGQVNYTSPDIPWTRIVEHKFLNEVAPNTDYTIITKEFPCVHTKAEIPMYPINDETNQRKYDLYYERSLLENNVIFGGRLAEYRYYDMHMVIGSAMKKVKNEIIL